MKKIMMLMLTIAMALMLSVSTASAWFVSIEPLDCTLVNDGDTFYADIFFNPDAVGNELLSYDFAIGYDATELTFVNATNTPPAPLIAFMGSPYWDEEGGEQLVVNWPGGSFTGPAFLTEKTQIGNIEFLAHPDMYCDGELDVWFADYGVAAEVFKVDGIEVDILATSGHILQGPDVTAVPIPGAALLLGSGLLGLVGIGRRKVMG